MKATGLAPFLAIPLLLAGCAAPSPTPSPTATGTSAAGCTPETAEFSWEDATQGSNGLVGIQIVTFSAGATIQTVESRNLAVEPFIQDADALNMLTDFDADANAEWMAALLADVARTGQVSDAFNTDPDLGDSPKALIDAPTDGTYIVSVESPQLTVPFTITCGGSVVVDSALSSIDSFGLASVAYRCGTDYGDDAAVVAVLDNCPES